MISKYKLLIVVNLYIFIRMVLVTAGWEERRRLHNFPRIGHVNFEKSPVNAVCLES